MLKKFFALALAVTFAVGLSCMKSVEAVTQSSFGNVNNYCTAVLSDDLMRKMMDRGIKAYATVKLNVKSNLGWNTDGKVEITMINEHDELIWRGVKNGGVTLKLGNDHPIYKIYVRIYYEGGNNPNVFQQERNFTNKGKCVTWEIADAKKCSIY